MFKKLLTVNNAKTVKGEKKGVFTAILYLAAHRNSGFNVCQFATAGCSAACLFTAGRGQMNVVQQARVRKTKEFFQDRDAFLSQLVDEIGKHVRRSVKKGMKPAIRLNGTSDIPWERFPVERNGNVYANIFQAFVEESEKYDLVFYDYTKNFDRMGLDISPNYYLTFSQAETDESKAQAIKALQSGYNVAVVFAQKPKLYHGFEVIDGDETDLRFLDTNAVVALKPKGAARRDKTGFVVQPDAVGLTY